MPVKVQGPDGKTYQFPDGTDKAAAVAYFHKNNIGVEAPGFKQRFGEATNLPTSMEQLKAAQPSTAEKIGGPAVTAGKMALDYGRNLVGEGRKAVGELRQPGGNINLPGTPIPPAVAQFLLRGVLGPVGGTGVANLGEDVKRGNVAGGAGDVLGTLLNAYMLKKAGGPSAKRSTNLLTSAVGKDMFVPIEKTLPEMRESAAAVGKPNSLESLHGVVTNAARGIQAEADAAMAPIANTLTMPTSIASNIRDLVTRDMGRYVTKKNGKTVFVPNSPEGAIAQRQIETAAKLYDKPWQYGDLDALRMRLNSELNTFEKKGTGARYTEKMGNLNTAIDSTIANTIRDIIYPRMDQLTGKPQGYFRGIKQKQGGLMELQSELDPKSRKSVTTKLRSETAESQGSPRFARENVSMHLGANSLKPRTGIYGLSRILKKPNPLASANKRVGKAFAGNPIAQTYTGTLPMRSSMFPATSNEQEQQQ